MIEHPTRVRVFLTPVNNRLIGSYSPYSKSVYVICDSSLNEFTVELPSLYNNENVEFKFYNIPISGLGNNVIITSYSINYTKPGLCTLTPGEVFTFIDSLDGTWIKG